MKKSAIAYLLLILMLIPVSAMSTPPSNPLQALQAKVEMELNSMDIDLSQLARDLTGQALAAPENNTTLFNLYNSHPSVIDVVILDKEGTILMVQPTKYQSAVGRNISDQEHFRQLQRMNNPVMSELFKTVEDFHAVSLAYPIMASDNLETIGYLSLVFQPQALVRRAVEQAGIDTKTVEIMALQENGRIIYDKDIMQVGNMTFSAPAYKDYPSLLELAKRIVNNDSGTGTYDFPTLGGKQAVQKEAAWTTVGLHGTEWRLVIAREI
ncbi:MAG: hypothetical protein JW782_00030 [Candidatus Saganbacteria bacterium]|nr:hypothetical protein [Candidatus Saganbacteria bacterium]